jgi:RNA polymerase sigma factor (sigma-70 family)
MLRRQRASIREVESHPLRLFALVPIFVVTSKAVFQTYIVGTIKVIMRADADDTALVAGTLGGDPEAFGCIVARYQALICSLAYSATGSLSQGEDIAQETFLAGWRQLRDLREPAKLRAWLCRIARNRICDALRQRERDPVSTGEPLEQALDFAAPHSASPDQAITHEEAAILWRSLQRIPQTYREPLVLFYREHRSIEQVANDLELSQDAVKQRLARGRKLLHKEVLAFVEGALTRTKPGQTFTNRVLSAVPGLPISAKAVGIGATAGISGAVFGPVLGIIGAWIGYRVGMNHAHSDERREEVRDFYRECLAWMAASLTAIALPLFLGRQLKASYPELAGDAAIGLRGFTVFLAKGSETHGASPVGGQGLAFREDSMGIPQPFHHARIAVDPYFYGRAVIDRKSVDRRW